MLTCHLCNPGTFPGIIMWQGSGGQSSVCGFHLVLCFLPPGIRDVYDNRTYPSICTFVKSFEFSVWYRNDPKFSDRQVLSNSVDPDQTTAPLGAV